MKYGTMILFLTALIALSCKEAVTTPTPDLNLLSNSSFELNGTPTLQGWTVLDTSAVHFSTDVPHGGSRHSIVFKAQWFAPWPNNSVFVGLAAQSGMHRYRLSYWGKKIGASGGVFVYLNRPTAGNSMLRVSLPVVDTLWTLYSHIDTIATTASDSLFINISGGGTEVITGTTYFNTCEFEKLE